MPTGPPVQLWAAVDSYHRCGALDVPDIPPRAWADAAGVHMVVGATAYHVMAGPTLGYLTRRCAVAWNETGDPDPSHFAGDEFLDAVHSLGNGTVVGLVHTEYPGNVYGNCPGPAYPHCWTVTLGLAVSHDGGDTWAHARPPPAHLVAAVPYVYNASQLASGWGDPSSILSHPTDGHYYVAFVNRNAVGLQPPGVCFARTADLLDPTSWRAWGGEEFNVTFTSPYTMPPGEAGAHICAVAAGLPPCELLGLHWAPRLARFVASIDCFFDDESQFWVATSPDLRAWSPAQAYYGPADLPANVSRLVTAMTYPTFLDPDAGDANMNTLGPNPLLAFVTIGHSPHTDGRRVWATPMRFTGPEGGAAPTGP